MLNTFALRADTPGTKHRLHFNNAGAALMPAPVIDAMRAHLQLEAEIGGYEAADERADEIEASYREIAALVGAAPRNIAITANATASFIQAISSFDLSPGDVIVTSRCDYTSNQIQYLALAARARIRVVHADDLPEGGIDPASVDRILAGTRVRFVAVSWIPTNSGLVQDVAGVGAVCDRHGVPFIVDACQAVGQIEIDVGLLRCDYLCATARKFLRGPRGVGFLYASEQALARGDHPLFIDMRGARWIGAHEYAVDPTARRYEDWEFPYALVIGQGTAVRYARDVGIAEASRRAWALAHSLRLRLAELPNVRVLDRGRVRCAIVTVDVIGVDASDIVAALTSRGINTVASLQEFGQLDFADKGVTAAVRISPHYYNTEDEVNTFVDAFHEIIT